MSAPYLEEIREYLLEHGDRDSCERDLIRMARDLSIPLDSLLLSLNNGIHKGYWRLEVGT